MSRAQGTTIQGTTDPAFAGLQAAFGSIFASPTKPQAERVPLAVLTAAKRRFNLPIAAIGGITLALAPQAAAAGADMLAVISDLFDTMNISARARDYAEIFRTEGSRT